MPETALNISKRITSCNNISQDQCDRSIGTVTKTLETFAFSLTRVVESFEKTGKAFNQMVLQVEKRHIEFEEISGQVGSICDAKIERMEKEEIENEEGDNGKPKVGH